MTAVEVEFWCGPLDGVLQAIPDDAQIWIVKSPMTRLPTKPEDGPPPTAVVEYHEYAYRLTERFGKTSGRRIFDYMGERVQK